MLISRREHLGALFVATAGIVMPACGSAQSRLTVTPEEFGAVGDGVSNDTPAFAAMADYVNRNGGGAIAFRPVTYLVGVQRQLLNKDYAFEPDKVLEFVGCTRPVIIRGNGARIRCADNLRFGTFAAGTGMPTRHKQPHYARGEIASPYRWMIKIENCSGPVEVSDLELDGNIGGLIIGGPWGDTGHQIPATGLGLYNNKGPEVVRNVYTHHHALDGIIIDGVEREPSVRSTITGLRSEYNGRQGCSIVGGNGYDFSSCIFNHTGKTGHSSAPGAGVDLEAEGGKRVYDLRFISCELSNNTGSGLIADSGDVEGATFTRCRLIGTTNWAAWPNKPRIRFNECIFVGSIIRCFGDAANPERATQFLRCRFRDDPQMTPNGDVFLPHRGKGPVVILDGSPNTTFSRCNFRLTHAGVLPWTTNVVVISDSVLVQTSREISYPRSTFRGKTVINGNVYLESAVVEGDLVVNGVRQPRGQI